MLDFLMPGLSGLELADRLVSDRSLRDVPLLVCTGSDDLRVETMFRDARAEIEVIRKPCDSETILKWLRDQLVRIPVAVA